MVVPEVSGKLEEGYSYLPIELFGVAIYESKKYIQVL